MESPYRAPSSPPEVPARRERADSDLLPFYFVVWTACLVHLVAHVLRREAWGGGETLTAILVVWLPSLLHSTIAARLRR